ncbi:hypothetical protein [uncultured Shimia sp.]|uniref:hypothetical protein n=1 Tax=uncultured Shimia sp. TaxID=573152 RepID=UPI0026111992|nr:hypothetical protein [uncultured Shimia sp.]
MRTWMILGVLCVATSSAAQEWKAHKGDVPFDAASLSAHLSGQTLVFFDEGRSVFESNGQYQYTYGGGGTWFGHWIVADNSTVCVTFVTGVERCDRIVENGGRLVMQTADGLRFPVKEIEAHS